MKLDREWAEAVFQACDPVFQHAGVGFEGRLEGHDDVTNALLWEADPQRFADRYPDSGVVESYGDQWPAPCIDYWIYVEHERSRCRLSIEGWIGAEVYIEATGLGKRDGMAIASVIARILHVPWPIED